MWCPVMQLAAEETEVTASQDDSSDIDDDVDDDEAEIDDDNEYDKDWMNEASDMSRLDNTNVLTTRQVTVGFVAIIWLC